MQVVLLFDEGHTLLAGRRGIEFEGEFDRRGGRAQIESVLEIGVARGFERVDEDEISDLEVGPKPFGALNGVDDERFL